MQTQKTIKAKPKQIVKLHDSSPPPLQQKQIEDTLRESEKRYRELVELMNEGLSTTDKNYIFTFVNKRFSEILGYQPDEIIGHHITEFFDDENKKVIEEQIAKRKQGCENQYDITWTTRDGQKVDTMISPRAFFDEQGNYEGSLGIFTDITERKKTLRQIAEAETKYRTLVEQIPAITYVAALDNTSATIYVSPQIEAIIGYPAEEFITNPQMWSKQLHPDDRQMVFEKLTRTHTHNEPFHCEYRMFTRKGQLEWFRDEAIVVKDDKGNPLFLQGIMLDITEQKQTEEELEKSEQKYRTLAESSPDAIFILNEKGEYLYINSMGASFLGSKPTDIIGKNIARIFPKQAVENVLGKIQRVLDENKTIDFGLTIPFNKTPRYFSATLSPIQDEQGNMVSLLGVAHDITERKLAEQKIQNIAKFPSENPFPVLRIKSDGTILYTNNAGMHLLYKWGCRVGDTAPDDWRKLITEVLGSKKNKTIEAVCANRVFSFAVAPVTEAGYVNIYGADITERKEIEENLLRYQQRLEELVEARTIRLTKTNRQLLNEIEQRKRLEREILDISEREQRRIGQELHDSVGQQFTGIAFMTKVLEQKLIKKLPQEAAAAAEIAKLVNEATVQARALAKGLYPIDLSADSLTSALHELASTTKKLFSVNCDFICDNHILFDDGATAVHLYRITQEAINNAIKHGQTKNIKVTLNSCSDTSTLTVLSDGMDFPEEIESASGMGLHIMQHRADLIEGSLNIRKNNSGGTIVTCIFPNKQN